jgi:hypothetical protein
MLLLTLSYDKWTYADMMLASLVIHGRNEELSGHQRELVAPVDEHLAAFHDAQRVARLA